MKPMAFTERLRGISGVQVKERESLAPYTSFRIGGPAEWFVLVRSLNALVDVLRLAREEGVGVFVLGAGTNLLISDKGVKGLVLKLEGVFRTYRIQGTEIISGASVPLAWLLDDAQERGLSGLEFAAGIPGTVGGAVVTNAGAFNGNIGEIIQGLRLVNKEGEYLHLSQEKFSFSYRHTSLQEGSIITEVTLALKRRKREDIREEASRNLRKRGENQPTSFSAGCIFKNPSALAAGQLIESLGLKGRTNGKARISTGHANFIENLGGATAREVWDLIGLIKERIRAEKGINLELEIKLMGEFPPLP